MANQLFVQQDTLFLLHRKYVPMSRSRQLKTIISFCTFLLLVFVSGKNKFPLNQVSCLCRSEIILLFHNKKFNRLFTQFSKKESCVLLFTPRSITPLIDRGPVFLTNILGTLFYKASLKHSFQFSISFPIPMPWLITSQNILFNQLVQLCAVLINRIIFHFCVYAVIKFLSHLFNFFYKFLLLFIHLSLSLAFP